VSVRIFFTTDIHGSETCFLKFINAAKFYKAQILIMGGDITGKMMVPIVRMEKRRAESVFMDKVWKLKSEEEIENLIKLIKRSGGYPYICTKDEYEAVCEDPASMERIFDELMVADLTRLVEKANDKLSKEGVMCYITPGNDDRLSIDKVLENHQWVVNPEGHVIQLTDQHTMISCGFGNMTPWNCPRDLTEEALGEKIDMIASQLEDTDRAIFNFHCPPYGTQIDDAPELNPDMTPKMISGNIHMIPVGSTAVRDAIQKFQPMLGLHGHIHESRGVSLLGRTKCFNPGSEYSSGYLRGLILDLDKNEVQAYQFTSG
jgi:uncharacterized protein